MRLADLDARFLKIDTDRSFWTEGISLSEAQGVLFLCPVCFQKNGGGVGTHSVICWFDGRGVPTDMDPKPGRWTPAGTGIADLTLNPPSFTGARSVRLLGGCNAHFNVTAGEIQPA